MIQITVYKYELTICNVQPNKLAQAHFSSYFKSILRPDTEARWGRTTSVVLLLIVVVRYPISGKANVINELSVIYHGLNVLESQPKLSVVYYPKCKRN